MISVPPLQLGIHSFQVEDREAFPPDLVDLLPFFPQTGFKPFEFLFKECQDFSFISVSN